MIAICLLLVCSLLFCDCRAQIFDAEDLTNVPLFHLPPREPDMPPEHYFRPEIIRERSGDDITLKCSASCSQNEDNKITWEFLQCQSDFKSVLCSNYYESAFHQQPYDKENLTWTDLKSQFKRRCNNRLKLINISEHHNGLYRCFENSTFVNNVFQVEVVAKYVGSPPKILDIISSNSTVSKNFPIIIQCKVYSKKPPFICWFKQTFGKHYDVEYNGNYYKRINTSHQLYSIPNEYNVFLSKLSIYNPRDVDGGVYVCLAMTEFGKDTKNTTVQVQRIPKTYTKSDPISLVLDTTNTSVNVTSAEWEAHTSFSLLFLIPVAFALIPISIWLCYYMKKKKNVRRHVENEAQERKLIKPVLHTNDITRTAPFV